MRSFTLLSAGLLSLVPVQAFIGMGIDMYNPSCAYACRTVIGMAMIECNGTAAETDHSMNMTGMTGMKKRHGDHDMDVTPDCRATSAPFLTTLAYCIHDRCSPETQVTRARLEEYWYAQSTGDPMVVPMWGYQTAYDRVNGTPATTYDAEAMTLNTTMLVDKDSWQAEKQSMEQFEDQERLNSRYV